ncbi:MAG: ABC transporter permease [Candidatus Aminicenantes bacterium]|nr:ABC transporter permease [Candidatus Aminicenantes bacterium]
MFRNYLVITLRNIKRHKGYSFINLAGLALGLACSILILVWVRDEVGTNRFHEKTDSLYVVRTTQHYGSETVTGTGSVPALGPALAAEYPEVLRAARINNGQGRYLLERDGKQFREPVQMADPAIFELFTFPLLRGDVRDLASGPDVMVLSESAARRIFGAEDPLGRTLTMDKTYDFRIAGIMKDIPGNSTTRFDIWMPLEMSRRIYRPNYPDTWYNMAFMTYLEMAPGTDIAAFNDKIFDRIHRADPESILEPLVYPFKDLYLEVWGRKENVRIFAAIAALILVIACINFMNLATARSARRAREVGLRKVIGADRGQVMGQFFGESLVFTFGALMLAIGLIAVILPAFRNLTAKSLTMADLLKPSILAAAGLVALATGLVAGLYPAVFLSSFKPVRVLKGLGASSTGAALFRKCLVVVQFALTALLIVGTLVIYSQIRFMKTKSLGFDREHLLYAPIEGAVLADVEAFKHELLRLPGVGSATAATHSPTGIYNNGQDWNWEGRDPNVNPLVTYFGVDPDVLETFKMKLVRGESFRPSGQATATDVLINETFAGIIGAPDVVGMRLTQGPRTLRILGVVEDFHFKPLDREIEPIILYYDPSHKAIQAYRYMFVRLDPGDVRAAVAGIEKAYRERNPDFPFEYRFLDDDYDRLYRSVEREMGLVQTFAALAILISSLGLFGLAAYTAEQRTKEIGIRKVLGANAPGIVALLSKEYARWVLAANLLAAPVAYLVMKGWLRDYAYRIPLGWKVFAAAAAATLLIAQLTVTWQAARAAMTNPAEVLRSE